jgi:hypothetical protein
MGSRTIRMAALIPHRDNRRILRSYSRELFARGFAGAWSFPWAAPLALLTRPLGGTELSFLAQSVRKKSLAAPGEGKFTAGNPLRFPLPGFPEDLSPGISLWGPEIGLMLRAEDFGPFGALALGRVFHRPVLACAVLEAEESSPPPPPVFSFAAAAVANMSYRLLGSGDAAYSFSWEIGELHWLPPLRRKRDARTCPYRETAVPEEPQSPVSVETGPDTQNKGPK